MELRFEYHTEQRWKMAGMSPQEQKEYLEKQQQLKEGQLFQTQETEPPITIEKGEELTESFPPYPPQFIPIEQPVSEKIDTKNEEEVLKFFNIYNANVEDYEFVKDKNGNITDVYPKNKGDDPLSNFPDRYSIRYDQNGNVSKTFTQDIDEAGNVLGQEVTNYNADGTEKNTIYYRYEFDENGNQTGQTRTAIDAKYGDEANALGAFGITTLVGVAYTIPPIGVPPIQFAEGVENVQKTQDGKITDFTYEGQKYSLRYDQDGNLTKTIVQKFDENGNVTTQEIKELDKNGEVSKHTLYKYEYDKEGNKIGEKSEDMLAKEPIETLKQHLEKTSAIERVTEMYKSETGNIRTSEDAMNKFENFVNNNTLAKLKAAGASNEEIKELLNELFTNLDSSLHGLMLSGGEDTHALIQNYREQYEKVLGETPMYLLLN